MSMPRVKFRHAQNYIFPLMIRSRLAGFIPGWMRFWNLKKVAPRASLMIARALQRVVRSSLLQILGIGSLRLFEFIGIAGIASHEFQTFQFLATATVTGIRSPSIFLTKIHHEADVIVLGRQIHECSHFPETFLLSLELVRMIIPSVIEFKCL